MITLQTAAEAEQFIQEHQKYCDAKLRTLDEFKEMAKGFPSDTPFGDYVTLADFATVTEEACQEFGLSTARFYELDSLDEGLFTLLLRAGEIDPRHEPSATR